LKHLVTRAKEFTKRRFDRIIAVKNIRYEHEGNGSDRVLGSNSDLNITMSIFHMPTSNSNLKLIMSFFKSSKTCPAGIDTLGNICDQEKHPAARLCNEHNCYISSCPREALIPLGTCSRRESSSKIPKSTPYSHNCISRHLQRTLQRRPMSPSSGPARHHKILLRPQVRSIRLQGPATRYSSSKVLLPGPRMCSVGLCRAPLWSPHLPLPETQVLCPGLPCGGGVSGRIL
jgi:hypothetical protein